MSANLAECYPTRPDATDTPFDAPTVQKELDFMDAFPDVEDGSPIASEPEFLNKETVTKSSDLPITKKEPRDAGTSGATT
jgi:hypothetical protein